MKFQWKLNKIVNFVIFTLVITAVYQTGMLWLESTASHNFFYSVFAAMSGDGIVKSQDIGVIEPEKIVLGYGNKKFSVLYPKEAYSVFIEESSRGLKEVFSNGKLTESAPLDYNEIFMSKCILFQYGSLITTNEYSKNLQIKNSSVSEQIADFDTIALIPARTTGETLKVYFINSKEEKSYCYTMARDVYSANLYTMIEQFQQKSDNELIYISTKQREFNIFSNNIFVPQWVQNSLYYETLEQKSPFEQDGVVYTTLLENAVDSFFKNYASKLSWRDELGAFCFSDETTVVKYYATGLIDYFNYESYDTSIVQTLSSAYGACKEFLKNDTTLETDIYLADIQIKSNEIKFCFDYHMNNFPIMLSQEEKQQNGITHAIEITVRGNGVKRYKRYAYNFVSQKEPKSIVNEDFISALNKTILERQKSGQTVTEVHNITLGYYAIKGQSVKLKWFTQIGEHVYISDTVK